MPTRNISLTAEQDAFIEQLVDAGEYQNASEVVRDGLRALQQRRREDALKLKALRAAIKQGLDSITRGDYVSVDDSQLKSYLDSLTVAGRKRPVRIPDERLEPSKQLISTVQEGRHPRRK